MRFLRIPLYIVGGLAVMAVIIFLAFNARYAMQKMRLQASLGPEAPTLTVDGLAFRDLNKNDSLDVYEDFRQPVEDRIDDLVERMDLGEKAGMMVHPPIGVGANGEVLEKPGLMNPMGTSQAIIGRQIRHVNLFAIPSARELAEWHNQVQKLAERTRLGIPVTISSDPRHGFPQGENIANLASNDFSKWPDPLGLAATRDSALVAAFGEIAAAEYRAVGIRSSLHPMVDIATEPRWARMNGTFGEDANLVAKLGAAYILGFQGDTLGPQSVATMTKHFPGGGPQKDGWDPHFDYGSDQVYPGNNFKYHLIPFEAAMKAGTRQVMPYYGIPVDQTSENVAMAFNKEIIDILREDMGFDGVICTDWLVISPLSILGIGLMGPLGWGVEDLSPQERVKKALDAGVDQFGGETNPWLITELVDDDEVTEERLDESVRRLLRVKFELGLFEDPYVDPNEAERIVGHADHIRAGDLAQRKAITLLKNGSGGESILPLKEGTRIYPIDIDSAAAAAYGSVVTNAEEADVILMRIKAPFEPQDGFFAGIMHQGDLDFKGEQLDTLLKVIRSKPTVVSIYLERAAVIPEVSDNAAALLATFGASDEAVLDVVFGRFNPSGRLPIELPSSMEAVEAQMEDVPYDSRAPLFRYGHGLSYGNGALIDSSAVVAQ